MRALFGHLMNRIKENAISISKLCIDSESTLMTTIDLANRK